MKNKRNNISSLAIAGAAIGLVLAACGDPDGGQQLAADVGGFADQQPKANAAPTVASSQAAVIAEALEQLEAAKATVPTLDPSIQAAVDRFEASRDAKANSIPTSEDVDAAVPAVVGPDLRMR